MTDYQLYQLLHAMRVLADNVAIIWLASVVYVAHDLYDAWWHRRERRRENDHDGIRVQP